MTDQIEIFDKDGNPINTESLEDGDIVFNSDGVALQYTEDRKEGGPRKSRVRTGNSEVTPSAREQMVKLIEWHQQEIRNLVDKLYNSTG